MEQNLDIFTQHLNIPVIMENGKHKFNKTNKLDQAH